MGMKSMGLVMAEAQADAALAATDTIVVNHFTTFTNTNNYWEPLEATVAQLAAYTLAGLTVLGSGQATLVAGVATVALPAITAGSLVFLTENSAAPNAVGAVVTAGTGFVIHSSSGADTSVVNYIVYG